MERELKFRGTMNFSMKDGVPSFVYRPDDTDPYGDLGNTLLHLLKTGKEIVCEKPDIASVDYIDLVNELGCLEDHFHDDVRVTMSIRLTRKPGSQTGNREDLGDEILLSCGTEKANDVEEETRG